MLHHAPLHQGLGRHLGSLREASQLAHVDLLEPLAKDVGEAAQGRQRLHHR